MTACVRTRRGPPASTAIWKSCGWKQQFIDAMEQQHISAAELARRVNRKPASISRDLSGGLSTAKLGRVREMADAVGYDVVALLVPRDPVERKKAIGRVAKELVG